MANELKTSFGVNFANGNFKDVIQSKEYQVSQTTLAFYSNLWIVGTSEEQLAMPVADVVTEGYLYILNTDGTNFIKWGTATGVYPFRLKAGEFCWVRLDPAITNIFMIADTASCKVLLKLYGD